MRMIGLIGGMSWESSAKYYRIINQAVMRRLGGLHSARCLMHSFDFADVEPLQRRGDWGGAATLMIAAARALQTAGADFLVICTNTMHKLAADVEEHTEIPLLHIADATAARVKSRGLERVGLLGTRFTMEEGFYRGRLAELHGLDVLVPPAGERAIVDRVIYDELCVGRTTDESRETYSKVIKGLVQQGASGIILGCTEIGMLVDESVSHVPLFDTTEIHANAAVDLAIKD